MLNDQLNHKKNHKNFLRKKKRFLIGQLGSFGDCLYATTIARQIKNDYPDCHLTWAIGSLYCSILDQNPHVDCIWEIPLSSREDILTKWRDFVIKAIERKNKGNFDELIFSQVFPNNLKYFDGTLRSSIFRAYNRPITVPVSPVLRLKPSEVENVQKFSKNHNLEDYRHVLLFECSPKSGQSFVNTEFAMAVSKKIIENNVDVCVILSTNEHFTSPNKRIIDGSLLSFRENAELTKFCTLLIGCSSGISWLCTSEWCKPLPMIQLLKKEYFMYASFVCDHEYHKLPTDSIIELTDCSVDYVYQCVNDILNVSFDYARYRYHKQWKMNFRFYAHAVTPLLLQKEKIPDFFISLRYTIRRYGFRMQIFFWCYVIFIHNIIKKISKKR